jgi:integrase
MLSQHVIYQLVKCYLVFLSFLFHSLYCYLCGANFGANFLRMENTNATASLFLDTRRAKKDDLYPVKITIYFEGEKKRYKTAIDLSESDWQKLGKTNLRDDELKLTKRKLQAKKEKAEAVIERLSPFSFEAFEERFFSEKNVRHSADLKALFEEYIAELKAKGRVGSASLYNTTINSLLAFKTNLRVTDITTKFLEAYEAHMLYGGTSPTSVGIYMRHLRAIVNYAISKKLLTADKYPFKGYAIPSSRNVKKALLAPQIKKLLQYKSDNEQVQKAVDFWLFSYISNGINFTDICNLKPSDIKGDFFTFHRAKTKNTRKRDKRPIKVPLTEETKAIIKKWRTTDHSNPYLFPILNSGLTALQEKYRIHDFIRKVNRHMKEVGSEIGFDGNMNTYAARHSHSTILKRSGASTELIKENLGHASVLTTENYLDDFEDEVKKEYARKLTDL